MNGGELRRVAMHEFPIDQLTEIAQVAEGELAYWAALFGVEIEHVCVTPGGVAVILNAAIRAGMVRVVDEGNPADWDVGADVDEEIREYDAAVEALVGKEAIDTWMAVHDPAQSVADRALNGSQNGVEKSIGKPDPDPAPVLSPSAVAALGPEHTINAPLRPIGRDHLPDPNMARQKLATALANGQAENLSVSRRTEPRTPTGRTLAEVDADAEIRGDVHDDERPLWKRKADLARKAGPPPAAKKPTKAQRTVSNFGTVLPTLDELVAELKRQAMGGVMPTQAAFNTARPATWAKSGAHLTRLELSWEQLADAAGLKPNRRYETQDM